MGETSFKIVLIIFNVIFLSFFGGIFIFIKEYRKKKRLHENELNLIGEEHRQELLKTKVEIQEQTMKYIGREIHDNIGQKLTLSSLYLQELVFEGTSKELNKQLEGVNTIINESLTELRLLSKSLTDDTIQSATISELIRHECNKIHALKQFHVEYEGKEAIPDLPYTPKSILLRIVQEFIQNSIKHSNCKKLKIELSNPGKSIQIILKDDGEGFDAEKQRSNGIGLRNMQKRVEMLNGVFELKSTPMRGTKLVIQIPQ